MISLTEENRVTARIGGTRATFVFPPFSELLADIARYVGRPMVFNQTGKLEDDSDARLLALFADRVKAVEDLKVRDADGKLVPLTTQMPGWTDRIDEQTRIKVAETVFGIPMGATFEACEALGDPAVVSVPVMGQTVRFTFPPMDDPAFQKAVKDLLSDHSQAFGNQVVFSTHAARMKFYRESCAKIDGAGIARNDEIPESWIASACIAFQRQEILAGQALGNS